MKNLAALASVLGILTALFAGAVAIDESLRAFLSAAIDWPSLIVA